MSSVFHFLTFAVLYVSKIKLCFYVFSYPSQTHIQVKMCERKAENDSKREYNEQWENELLFIARPSGKPLCIVCESTFSLNRRHDLSRHYRTQHQTKMGRKLKLVVGSELRKAYVIKKNEDKMHLLKEVVNVWR